MGYKKTIEVYKHTETVITDDEGNEVARFDNNDTYWYDTREQVGISDEEAEGHL